MKEIIYFLMVLLLGQSMTFDEFIIKFKKQYKPDSLEYLEKKRIFEENVQILKNSGCDVCGITKFFDIKQQQFEHDILDLKFPEKKVSDQFPTKAANVYKVGAPPSVDWRKAGVLTSVKQQGQCGSCWAFSTVALAESSLILKGEASRNIDLSQQFLLECTPDSNCGGGLIENALEVAIKKGIPSEKRYPYDPYIRHKTICYNIIDQDVSQEPAKHFYGLSDEEIKDLLTLGPVAITVSSTRWQYYTGGIWKCKSDDRVNHAVLLVGYTREAWIIKNHWGADWGEDGYIRVSMEPNQNCGIGSAVHILQQTHYWLMLLTSSLLFLLI